MFFITKILFVVMITLHKTKKVSFYYLMPILLLLNKYIIIIKQKNFLTPIISLINFQMDR